MGTRSDLDMAALATQLRADLNAMFKDSVGMVTESVVNGSPITGSPGQPVEDGDLVRSTTTEWLSPTRAVVGVDENAVAADWALQNEDGIARPGGGAYRLLSPVGGRWSYEKTVAGWGAIVDTAIAKQGQALIGGGFSD